MGKLFAHVRGLSPLGPIFGKELRSTARRKRTYILRFLYLGALLLILLFFDLVVMSSMSQGGSVAARAQRNAEMGLGFFAVFSFFTLIAMGLIGPILTSTAVNSERLHKTLAVLLMTPITAWQIVSGKLFSRLLIALTLIGLSLPVLAVVRLLGGVELEQMVGSLTLCVATVFLAAALGLLFSTLMNRAYAVILLAYGFMFFLWALVPMFMGMLLAASGSMSRGQLLFSVVSLTNPFVGMEMLCVPDIGVPLGMFGWQACSLFQAGLGALMLVASALILRRMGRKEADSGGGAPSPISPLSPMPLMPAPLPPPPLLAGAAPAVGVEQHDPDIGAAAALPPPLPSGNQKMSRPAKAAREVSDNPVLWREIRRPLMARRWQALVAVILILGVLVMTYILLASMGRFSSTSPLAEPDSQIGFAIVFCALFNVLVCIVSATAIAQEKESDTWTLLLATPMRARRIVWGKVAGLLRRMMWPAILIVAHFLLFTVTGVISLVTFAMIVWMIFTTNAIWLAMGLYYSLRLKTVTFAVILNLISLVIFYGGAAMVLGIAGELYDHSDNWAEVVGLYAPYPYMVVQIDRYDRWRQNTSYQHDQNRPQMPVFDEVDWLTFWEYALFCGLGHLAATGLILGYTVWRFDRIVGRAPQLAALVDVLPPARPSAPSMPAASV